MIEEIALLIEEIALLVEYQRGVFNLFVSLQRIQERAGYASGGLRPAMA